MPSRVFCVFHNGFLVVVMHNLPFGKLPSQILADYARYGGFKVENLTYDYVDFFDGNLLKEQNV